MSTIYSNSENIRIFPTIGRTVDTEFTGGTNWLTQYNICSLVNKLCGVDGFVISETIPTDPNTPYEFNIQGFIISVKNIVNQFTSSDNIYAYITLTQGENANISDIKLANDSVEQETTYRGVTFCAAIPEPKPANQFYLHIAEKVNSVWRIPEDSKIKFKTDVLRIDDGVLEEPVAEE